MIALIRPSNVLINEYGDLKLCDFGLAKKIVDMIQGINNNESAVFKLKFRNLN